MAKFKNFSMWRKRLPHWRADDVTYYVTFRHRRDLSPLERQDLFKRLTLLKDLELFAMAVFADHTELMGRLNSSARKDLSEIVDRARNKVIKLIQKKSGERFPVFYGETYDHIVRDEAEYEEFCDRLLVQIEALDEELETVWFAEETPAFED